MSTQNQAIIPLVYGGYPSLVDELDTSFATSTQKYISDLTISDEHKENIRKATQSIRDDVIRLIKSNTTRPDDIKKDEKGPEEPDDTLLDSEIEKLQQEYQDKMKRINELLESFEKTVEDDEQMKTKVVIPEPILDEKINIQSWKEKSIERKAQNVLAFFSSDEYANISKDLIKTHTTVKTIAEDLNSRKKKH
ncbi:hypothetical protein WA158_003997 [Blastocystis sp. Blastoise]